MPLDTAGAPSALASVGGLLGLASADTAAGIHELVNQNMAAAARMHAVEQGADLRGITLLAFGGAGPVHACGVAELLESPRVIFPVNASVLSAFGTLVTPVRIDLARSMVRPLDNVDDSERDALLDELRAEGRRVLAAAGVAEDRITVPLRPRCPLPRPGQRDHDLGRRGRRVAGHRRRRRSRSSKREYRRIYGLTIPDVGVEAVTWRLSAFAAGRCRSSRWRRSGERHWRSRSGTACGALPSRRQRRSTRRCTGGSTSASASASTARRSSRSARRRR